MAKLFDLNTYFPKMGGGSNLDVPAQFPRGSGNSRLFDSQQAPKLGTQRTGYPWPDARAQLQMPKILPFVRRGGYPWPDLNRPGAIDPQPGPGPQTPTPRFPNLPNPGNQAPLPQPTQTPPFYPGPFFPIPGSEADRAPLPQQTPGPFDPNQYPNLPQPSPMPQSTPGPYDPNQYPNLPQGGGPVDQIPTVPAPLPGPPTDPNPNPNQMSPLNPMLLYGLLSYLASHQADGNAAAQLAQYRTPDVTNALAQIQNMLPSTWLPQLRAQFQGSQYRNLF